MLSSSGRTHETLICTELDGLRSPLQVLTYLPEEWFCVGVGGLCGGGGAVVISQSVL